MRRLELTLAMSVFALFRATVRIVDHTTRLALSRMLFDNVTSTAPGEKLDEKLASLTFSNEPRECKDTSLSHALVLNLRFSVQYRLRVQTKRLGGIPQVSVLCPVQ